MKVTIQIIPPAGDEHADLYVRSHDKAVDRLHEYITSGSYREVTVSCAADGEIHLIPSHHIHWIESIQEKQFVHTKEKIYETRKRLYELEQLLPPHFVRISKSVILNTQKAASYRPQINGLMQVTLLNGDVTYISRKYLKEVRKRILEVRHEEKVE